MVARRPANRASGHFAYRAQTRDVAAAIATTAAVADEIVEARKDALEALVSERRKLQEARQASIDRPKPTELTTRRGDETAPGRACATHAFYRAVASAELYAPVPAGDCPSSGCSTANCLCKKHDTECLSV